MYSMLRIVIAGTASKAGDADSRRCTFSRPLFPEVNITSIPKERRFPGVFRITVRSAAYLQKKIRKYLFLMIEYHTFSKVTGVFCLKFEIVQVRSLANYCLI